jgi:hypothetical protein
VLVLKQIVDSFSDHLDLFVLCRSFQYSMKGVFHHLVTVGSSYCVNWHDELFPNRVKDSADLFL